MSYFFIGGMFRSGTTLLGRMLHAHPELVCASDPCLPILKFFRSLLARHIELNIPPQYPLQDYYYDVHLLTLFKLIQKSSLNESIPKEWMPAIKNEIKHYGEPYSPLIMPYLDRLSGETFADLLRQILEIIREVYGQNTEKVVGFKEVWGDEFIPAMARAFPEMKFVILVRDPRAVAASKNITQEKYPWLFLALQWRKLAALAWYYTRHESLTEKVLVIKFEDLISSPEEIAKKICTHIGVSFNPEMLNPERYVDGFGKPWRQNTSYGNGLKGFDQKAISRWQKVLSNNEKLLIELVCGPEMFLHGYLESFSYEALPKLLCDFPEISLEERAAWIAPLFPPDGLSERVDLSREALRAALLTASVHPTEEVLSGAFLFPEIWEKARVGMI